MPISLSIEQTFVALIKSLDKKGLSRLPITRFADVNWKCNIYLGDPSRYLPITTTYQYYYLKQIRISAHLDHDTSKRHRRKKNESTREMEKRANEKEPETRRTGPLRFLKRYK